MLHLLFDSAILKGDGLFLVIPLSFLMRVDLL